MEASAAGQPPLETFDMFPALPKELQLKIWQHAVAESATQVVKMSWEPPSPGADRVWLAEEFEAPALLTVCRDAREVALKTYPLTFPHLLHRPIRFNLDKDIVMLEDEFHAYRFSFPYASLDETTERLSIKTLAIRTSDGSLWEEQEYLYEAIWGFGGLKEMILLKNGADMIGPTDLFEDRNGLEKQEEVLQILCEGMERPSGPEIQGPFQRPDGLVPARPVITCCSIVELKGRKQ